MLEQGTKPYRRCWPMRTSLQQICGLGFQDLGFEPNSEQVAYVCYFFVTSNRPISCNLSTNEGLQRLMYRGNILTYNPIIFENIVLGKNKHSDVGIIVWGAFGSVLKLAAEILNYE